jgi:hypothetical protein
MARLARGFQAEKLEAAVKAIDVTAGFREVLLQPCFELIVRGGLRQFRQGLDQLGFGVVLIGEFVDEEIAE